jgi:HEAT repeat protein
MQHAGILVTALLFAVVSVAGSVPAYASIGNGQQEPSDKQVDGKRMSLDELHMAADSAHTLTRLDAIQRIANRANPASLQVLQTALSDPEPLVRQSTVVGLAAIGDAAVPALVAALKDEDPMVRHGAGMALAEFPSSETVRQLLAGLVAPQSRSAGNSDHSQNFKRLDWGQSVLVISKKLLRQINASKPETTEILINKLSDAEDRVRYVAAYALSMKSDPEIVSMLNAALARKDTAMVSGAYEFFMQRHFDRAKPFILRGLREFNDPDLAVSMSRSGDAGLAATAVDIAKERGVDLRAEPSR